jgi:ribonuclease HI
MPKLIEAWFDGCCEPKNPGGHAAWGAVVHINGESVYRAGGYCGVGPTMSNNVAEYSGFLAALTEALKYEGQILVRGDSRLVICQLSIQPQHISLKKIPGKWMMRGGLYSKFFRQAEELLRKNAHRTIALEWIPREQNDICDVLSKKELHDRGVVFRIQPE